jgi:anti-sigma regulatory factor (Ser/Thr protein kinase)
MTPAATGSSKLMDGRIRAAATAAPVTPRVPHDGFQHVALLFNSEAQLLSEASAFVRAGLARGEAVIVTVPGLRHGPLRLALGADAGRVFFRDAAVAGRNPARTISALAEFAAEHPGRRISSVGECAWAGRPAREVLEAVTSDALANRALEELPMTALCPYGAHDLPAPVVDMARQTHPLLAWGSRLDASGAYLGPHGIPAPCLEPLPPPPPHVETMTYQANLAPVRALTRRRAGLAGLPPERAGDLVIAVSELAANTLVHSPDGGVLRVWQTAGELVCEVSDQGWVVDPLAGHRLPRLDDPGGQGLWVVNQVCDLVERRTGPGGTTTRLHMDRPAQTAVPPG